MSGTESLIVSRGELALPDLELHNPGTGFEVYGTVSFGGRNVERVFAAVTPWTAFERPTHIRRTNGTYVFRVVVSGDTAAQLEQRIDRLEEAVCEQVEFRVDHTLDGLTRSWVCIAADLTPDTDSAGLDEVWHGVFMAPFVITGPHMGRA